MRTWTKSLFSTCRSKAVTASFSPVNDKPLIRSLIFGKIKKSHGARSKLNAGKHCHGAIGRDFVVVFPKAQGKQMVSFSGIVQTGPVLEKPTQSFFCLRFSIPSSSAILSAISILLYFFHNGINFIRGKFGSLLKSIHSFDAGLLVPMRGP
ncbi:hypothetical protein EVAR_22656_1 [Eumeta japonica]|uniref:Uncharacterized protein n=1 Tax=Eumeta variegata TaxID=151549 RepID=A0A4C1VL61_EUMVA|nr:hypothetical protein EVAR_22656_1 [Eumeta japonica]